MLQKLQTDKRFKVYFLLIAGLFGFSAYFMVSLTFQYIGNKISNPELITAFVFGLISPIILTTTSYLLFWKKLHTNWQISLLIITIVALIFVIISLTFGTIGYLKIT